MGVLVDWSAVFERVLVKNGNLAILITPGHHQGPGCAGLRL